MKEPSEHVRAYTPWGLWRNLLGAMILLLLSGALQHRARSEAAPAKPVFDETTCDLPHLSPEIAPRVRCGTVSVPRDYGNPERGSFKLAVVVVGNAQKPAHPDPVVYINGGPGSPLTAYADYQSHHRYAASRDLILVDQRGVGRSEPHLCPGVAPALLGADLAVVTAPTAEAQAQAQARRRSAFTACRNEARAKGIDLDDFGTAVTAEDFELIRQALGIARWNVVGESYGTTVAMTLMARHPDGVRSAVLDSINPPDPLPPPWVRAAEARVDFFALCEHDPGCAAAYPDLGRLYRQTLQQLGQAPPAVSVPPWLHQPDNRAPLTVSMFEVVIDGLLYVPTSYPRLPRLVVQVHDEDTSGFAAALAVVLVEREALNIAVNAAVECRDRPQYRKALAQDAEALRHTGLYGICGEWSALGPAPVIPTGTAVPTLVLAGQFDPNASPALSHRVAELIGARAHWIEFPRLGHNVRQFSACASGIVAAFIGAPEQTPDASCAQRRPPIHFLPR